MTALADSEHFCNVGGTFIKWLARLWRKAISYEVCKFKLFIQWNSMVLWATWFILQPVGDTPTTSEFMFSFITVNTLSVFLTHTVWRNTVPHNRGLKSNGHGAGGLFTRGRNVSHSKPRYTVAVVEMFFAHYLVYLQCTVWEGASSLNGFTGGNDHEKVENHWSKSMGSCFA